MWLGIRRIFATVSIWNRIQEGMGFMKAMRLEDWGLENLKQVTLSDPEPASDEVLIRIGAVSINPRDGILMQGGYGRKGGTPPLIPLCDGAGVIAAVGTNVTNFTVGDFVIPAFSRNWLHGSPAEETYTGAHGGPLDGTMRELMPVPANAIVRAPPHMSVQEAATLPCAALTAWSAVVGQGGVKAGDKVLIQGTGAVSLFALQFAKMQGAEVILTSSSDEKLERVAHLGADHTINYRQTPEWHRVTREITNGRGLDHIVDIGGAGTLEKALSAIRISGSISLIGVLGGSDASLPLGRVVTQNIRLQGVTVGSHHMLQEMVNAMALHKTKPVLDDQTFEFGDLANALKRLKKGEHIGKIVCAF
jgi:NADPH:quinone reductase-like Zn-dependent oxidoreductase